MKFVHKMSTKVTKAERLLNALAKQPLCELTPEGAEYIKQRFDPYHDTPMRPVGYPDAYDGHTVSRCIKKSITFNATSGDGTAPTTTWDCMIAMTPFPQEFDVRKPIDQTNNQITFNDSTSKDGTYGGLMIRRSDNDNGSWTWPNSDVTRNLGNLSLSDDEIANMMRVTAMGFEVIDGTAELYRQGILTAFRQNEPQHEELPFKGYTSGGGATAFGDYIGWGRFERSLPTNVADAVTIPDTKQWKVSEGAYVDIDFNSIDIPMQTQRPVIPVLQAYAASTSTDFENDSIAFFQKEDGAQKLVRNIPGTSPQAAQTSYALPNNRFYDINQSGIILSGMNPQASITVNAIWYVECAPSGEDPKLLTLASQSPAQDDFALMLISKLRRDSPVAVKLRENYMGEWFFTGVRDLLKSAAPWLSNAQEISNQAIKWIDTASTNNGYINPQTFVKGDVAKKVAAEKKGKVNAGPKIPKAPGPAPKSVAFLSGKPVVLKNAQTGMRLQPIDKAAIKMNRRVYYDPKGRRYALDFNPKYEGQDYSERNGIVRKSNLNRNNIGTKRKYVQKRKKKNLAIARSKI